MESLSGSSCSKEWAHEQRRRPPVLSLRPRIRPSPPLRPARPRKPDRVVLNRQLRRKLSPRPRRPSSMLVAVLSLKGSTIRVIAPPSISPAARPPSVPPPVHLPSAPTASPGTHLFKQHEDGQSSKNTTSIPRVQLVTPLPQAHQQSQPQPKLRFDFNAFFASTPYPGGPLPTPPASECRSCGK